MAILGGYSILDMGKYGPLDTGSRITPPASDILNFKNRNKPIYVQNLTISNDDASDITLNQFGERVTIDEQEQLLLHEGAVSITLDGNQLAVTFNLG